MKNVLITGASRGLGKEVAVALSEAGYAVCANYSRSKKEALGLSTSLKNTVALKADVGDMKQVGLMAGELRKKWSALYAVINNAGVTKDSLLIKQTEKDWDEIIKTNLTGCFNTIKTFAPWIAESGGGHIINISSRSGLKGKEGQAAYSASKAGLLGLTYSAAKELAPDNIKVNAVLPGYMPTEMGSMAGEAMRKAEGASLFGRLSDPRDVARFIVWLLESGGITGQVFNLDSRI